MTSKPAGGGLRELRERMGGILRGLEWWTVVDSVWGRDSSVEGEVLAV
jgi:hypothetical protein